MFSCKKDNNSLIYWLDFCKFRFDKEIFYNFLQIDYEKGNFFKANPI
jgi:hypothetical protein